MFLNRLFKWRLRQPWQSKRTAADLLEVFAEKYVRRRALAGQPKPYNSAFSKARAAGVDVNDYLKRNRWVTVPKVKGEVVYGTYPVMEGLKANRRTIHKLFMKASLRGRSEHGDDTVVEVLRLAKQRGVPVKTLITDQLDVLTEYQLHNGLCMDASSLAYEQLSDERVNDANILLYLDRVLDPGNIGAIARSSFYFGIDGIVMARGLGPKSLTAAMSKASAGALEYFPVYSVDTFPSFHKRLHGAGWSFIGTADEESALAKGCASPTRLSDLQQTKRRTVIVMGDEGRGVSAEILKQCDRIVQIPNPNQRQAHSSVTSLNVSVSAAILLYHLSING